MRSSSSKEDTLDDEVVEEDTAEDTVDIDDREATALKLWDRLVAGMEDG